MNLSLQRDATEDKPGHKNIQATATTTCLIKAREDPDSKVRSSTTHYSMNTNTVPADSWIDLSSQQSSSHVDQIVTAGLSLRDGRQRPFNTRLQQRSTSATGSSQDEYDESESESDRVMSSSNEDIHGDDDTRTALGVNETDRTAFTPQPNAFSHPPSVKTVPVSNSMPVDSYFPPQSPPLTSSYRIPSNRVPTIQRPQLQQRNTNISPDHDAALRASLTTLLSCANAVRKDKAPVTPQQRTTQVTGLRLVPESQLSRPRQTSPAKANRRRSRESSKERLAKKPKAISHTTTSEDLMVSPTMMTWFISAGMVLVFSALSFSAGYAWGKEVGRAEGQIGYECISCSREAMRESRTGFRNLRLSAVGA